jgi:N-acyl-D-aspartate/D-glutamate deacylase
MRQLFRFVVQLLLICTSLTLAAQSYDIVLRGGRVIDPETGLDGVRNVGINGRTIAVVTAQEITGKRVIDATGLVVAPGFIDLHQHGQSASDYELKVHDGVTTALEMEIGAPDVEKYLIERSQGALINYGTTANYDAARARAFGVEMPAGDIIPQSGPATNDAATPAQLAQIKTRLEHELNAGALGIGVGIQYIPGAGYMEILSAFRIAAEHHLPVFTHLRSAGATSIAAVSEVIADAAITGAPLQIVHVHSTCTHQAPECLEMIRLARARGLDVTTEAYPYEAGMTFINSALFNPGWQQQLGISYGELAIPATGERLTKERFEQLHADPKPQTVLVYANPPEIVDRAIRDPEVMIASDGIAGHPREAGTFCRILAKYVREEKSLTLMEAIRKMSLMPAERLAASTTAGKRKGRIQAGADADIVVFNLNSVQDQATYAAPKLTSTGIEYVLVGGVPVIERGELQQGRVPGRAIVRDK